MDRLRNEESMYTAVTGDYRILSQKMTERKQDLDKFLKDIENFDVLWENAVLEEKKHFLRNILKEVRAGSGKIEIDFRF